MWQEENEKLHKQFVFKDFEEAMDFINKVAELANSVNHHPTIKNTWNTVDLWLTTHEAGDKITDKDRELADLIDSAVTEADESPVPPAEADIQKVKIFTDGGSRGNPGPSALGYVITDMEDSIIEKGGVYLGITTNNQAEYQGLKVALEKAYKLGAREAEVYMDSLLVINQMKGIFKVKNRDLWPIHEAIKEQATKFKKVSYAHVPRNLNKLADAEVNETLDNKGH